MGFLGILLLVFFLISAVLLIFIVLVQDEGGDGLGGIFGGGGASQVGNRSGNILTKTTSVLGAVFLLSSFGLAWINRTPETGNVEGAARQLEAQEEGSVNWWETEEEAAPEGEDAPGALEESD
ncbi:MAG: preprotein translocase subunit SecG [Alkalispirochaetaceae bacterium]